MNISTGMEKHISEDKIQIHFYMFARVEPTHKFQKNFFHKECDIKTVKAASSTNIPKWIEDKNIFSDLHKNIIVLNVKENQLSYLKDYCKNFTFKGEAHGIDEYIKDDEFRQYVLYNLKLKFFMHCIEMVFECPTQHFCNEDIVKVFSENSETDFYNCFRNGMIKTADSPETTFVENSIKEVKNTVVNFINSGYNIAAHESDFLMGSDCTNITLVALQENEQLKSKVEASIMCTNKFAERLEYFDNHVSLYGCECLFNGRFQTIITTKPENQYHFVPITYQAQFIWSYLVVLEHTIENLNITLQQKNHAKAAIENNKLISAMIEKIQILSYDNEVFIRSIENEYDLIYKKFETSWHLSSSMQAAEKYIANLNDYLNRAHMEESERISLKQNQTLFVISLLQVLAFVSIWSDFLDLGEEYGVPFAHLIGINFSSFLNTLNMFLPIILISITLVLLISSFKKSRR